MLSVSRSNLIGLFLALVIEDIVKRLNVVVEVLFDLFERASIVFEVFDSFVDGADFFGPDFSHHGFVEFGEGFLSG